MTERDPVWLRPVFEQTNAKIEFDLYCFSVEPIDLSVGSPAAEPWCPCGEISDRIDIGSYDRASAVAARLFDSILTRPMGRASLENPETTLKRFNQFRHLNCVEVRTTDSADLSYVQEAWATVRWLVRNGAAAVYDDAARRWRTAQEVEAWPTPRPQVWASEVGTVLETDGERMMHSRGMKKFGRPDLLVELGSDATAEEVKLWNAVLDSVQEALVHGRVLAPGRPVIFQGSRFEVERYQPGRNAPDVMLENDGLLLRREGEPRRWRT